MLNKSMTQERELNMKVEVLFQEKSFTLEEAEQLKDQLYEFFLAKRPDLVESLDVAIIDEE